ASSEKRFVRPGDESCIVFADRGPITANTEVDRQGLDNFRLADHAGITHHIASKLLKMWKITNKSSPTWNMDDPRKLTRVMGGACTWYNLIRSGPAYC